MLIQGTKINKLRTFKKLLQCHTTLARQLFVTESDWQMFLKVEKCHTVCFPLRNEKGKITLP